MANNEYKAVGHDKRKNFYTAGIVIAAVALVLALIITFSNITMADVEEFGVLWLGLISAISAILYGIQSLLARKNVEPPSIEPSPEPRHGNVSGPDDYDPRLGGKPKNQV